MDKMMKALRFHPDTKKFSLDDVPIPKLNDEDNVLVKVAAAGFCGTDLHIMAVGHNCMYCVHFKSAIFKNHPVSSGGVQPSVSLHDNSRS